MNIEEILELLKNEIETINPVPKEYLVSSGNDNGFEKLVSLIAKKVELELNGIFESVLHYGHHFPDMDIIINNKRYGLELKSRNNGTWDTNGNSVFESISDETYEEIFLLFGSKIPKEDRFAVKYSPYWMVTSAISVTHSPRFKINMNTTESVFNSAIEYHQLREKTEIEKVIFLQNYLKQTTNGAKWFIPQDSESISPISLNSLATKKQNHIKAEIIVLYPQDLMRNGRADYSRSHEFLITNYFYYSSSFRDFFSAGGKWLYRDASFPRAIGVLHSLHEEIRYVLNNANDSFVKLAYHSWEELGLVLSFNNFQKDYFAVINYIGNTNYQKEISSTNLTSLSDFI